VVLIEECRPLAKTKAWRVSRLIEKSRAADAGFG
jgi:ribosomal protein S17